VLASGEVMRLGKNTVKGVAGYDLVSLVVGSEGTLALVTEITVSLLPKPRVLQTALLQFDSNEMALQAVTKILHSGFLPKTLEYMDASCMEGYAALVIECDGDEDESVLNILSELVTLANPTDSKVALSEKQREEIWEHRRQMSVRLKKRAAYKISEDIVVPRSQILAFSQGLQAIGQRHQIDTAVFGHAGDGNLHAQLLMKQETNHDKALLELFELTVQLGGTISGEHGIGLAKKAYLSLEQTPSVIALQQAIKKVWDPDGMLNPGKIF
ncbi:MAG: FAD-linked oxidase C-terminal domain-containing protein, partial [Myxococcota bacterium]